MQQRNLDLPSTPASADDIEAPVGGETPISGIMEVVDLAIYWENPVLSTVLCILGILVAIVGEYLLKGRHGVPLLSGDLSLNPVRVNSEDVGSESACEVMQSARSIRHGAPSYQSGNIAMADIPTEIRKWYFSHCNLRGCKCMESDC